MKIKILEKKCTSGGKAKYFTNCLENAGKAQAPNPFADFFNKTMQATNLVTKPMTQEEAIKILNIKDQANFTPEEVMKVY